MKEFPLPFGTDLDDVPLDEAVLDQKDDLQKIVQLPYTRSFIRSRVANSFSLILAIAGRPGRAGHSLWADG